MEKITSLQSKVDTTKELLWPIAVEQSLKKLFMVAPVLGWPPIAFLLTYFIKTYSEYLYESVKMFLSEQNIIFKNREAQELYTKAHFRLNEIAQKNGIDSLEFTEARNENRKLLENAIMYDAARRMRDSKTNDQN